MTFFFEEFGRFNRAKNNPEYQSYLTRGKIAEALALLGWASIGADGYAPDAASTAELCQKLLA